jgi:hypothetical protein
VLRVGLHACVVRFGGGGADVGLQGLGSRVEEGRRELSQLLGNGISASHTGGRLYLSGMGLRMIAD